MTCRDITQILSEGRPLPEAAQEHIRSCASCQTILQVPADFSEGPNQDILQQVEASLLPSLHSVRPLPSNAVLISWLLALFVVFSVIATIPVGFSGLHVLTWMQRSVYYSALIFCAFVLAHTVAKQMVPGSKRGFSPVWAVSLIVLFLAALTAILFPDIRMDRFVRRGIPCLCLGSLSAAVAGMLAWIIVRRGFFTSPVAASMACGFLAGLSGVAVLALHCPVLEVPHILVWHFGAMMLIGLGGAVLGFLGSRLFSK